MNTAPERQLFLEICLVSKYVRVRYAIERLQGKAILALLQHQMVLHISLGFL